MINIKIFLLEQVNEKLLDKTKQCEDCSQTIEGELKELINNI